MIETIAMFGGIIGGVVSVLAIVAFFMLKKNIVNILSKDTLVFDKNFELKKSAICESMLLTDFLADKGKALTLNQAFRDKARACHNNLMCVVTDIKLVDEFYAIALDRESEINSQRIIQYKILCRKEMGFSFRKSILIDKLMENSELGENEAILRANAATNGNANLTDSLNGFSGEPVAKINKPAPTKPSTPDNV